jgi:alpha-glucosidase (family GH31 glycosyl hydrolase)
LFTNPIYNTWIELTFYQNEADVLKYASSLIASGMPPGVLMIDDGWSEYYGDWKFHTGKFPNFKEMLTKLHQLGFQVMLWVCPFITADTIKYREARNNGLLIKDNSGKPYIVQWWNGYSAVLDFTNPNTNKFMSAQLESLLKIGVDGFKFDAGDSVYYKDDNITYGNVTPNEQSNLWAIFGEQYEYNEFRVTFGAGGYGLLQRLCDKEHSWGENGIKSLIPDTLLQGITGHPYSCPDMIGGGEYKNFHSLGNDNLDQELFIRHSEIACLMPAMQFSAAPYRVLNSFYFNAIMKSIETRSKYQTYINECLESIKTGGEPVIRYMSYEFPDEPVELLIDQFMLGKKYLIAPICEKGINRRKLYLPKGKWKKDTTEIQSQGEYVVSDTEFGIPIIFERL